MILCLFFVKHLLECYTMVLHDYSPKRFSLLLICHNVSDMKRYKKSVPAVEIALKNDLHI